MARKARWFGLLATYRELTPEERAAVDRLLEDDPEAREAKRRFDEQDAALVSLDAPPMNPAVTDRVMAATVARNEGAVAPRLRPLFAVVLSLVLMALVAGTGLASSASLPGDALYPLKRAGEQARMALTLREQSRARYAVHLIEVRRQEVNALLELGRAGISVEFEGPLEYAPTGEWLVAGVPVALPEGAAEMPQIAAGSPVHVTGAIGEEQVRVRTMRPVMSSGVPGGPPMEPGRGESAPGTPDTPPHPPAQGPASDGPRRGDPPTGGNPAPAPTSVPPATKGEGHGGPEVTPPGQADRDIPPGQGDTDTPPGQVDKDTPPGQVDRDTSSGQTDEGIPPGQADKDTPPGRADEDTPPGQADKGTPPGQADKGTPPGQADKGTPPGQIQERTPPGLDKGPQTPAAPESQTSGVAGDSAGALPDGRPGTAKRPPNVGPPDLRGSGAEPPQRP